MGLAIRIIPALLKRGEHLVKGTKFSADRVVGHVQQAARIHQARGVDELIILDVAATKEGRGPDFKAIEELTKDCFMPLTVGGGVRNLKDVDDLLRSGADKVAVRSLYFKDPHFLELCSEHFGCQAMVMSVDYFERDDRQFVEYLCTGWSAIGAGEILLTNIDREGMMTGYDIETIARIASAVKVPVIAHGGCSGPEDMLHAIEAGASAVAAGALFQFTDWTPRSCALWLKEHGVEVRV